MRSRVVLLGAAVVGLVMVVGSVLSSEDAQHPSSVYFVLFLIGILLIFLALQAGAGSGGRRGS